LTADSFRDKVRGNSHRWETTDVYCVFGHSARRPPWLAWAASGIAVWRAPVAGMERHSPDWRRLALRHWRDSVAVGRACMLADRPKGQANRIARLQSGARMADDLKPCKRCTACNEWLPLCAFTIAKQNPDGLKRWCRACSNAKRAQWAKNNPEKAKALKRRQHAKHRQQCNERSAEWRRANPTKAQEHWDRWHAQRPEARKEARREWQSRNLAYGSKASTDRRAQAMRAIPAWAESEFESLVAVEAYSLAQLRTQIVGIKYHVDHVVPLRGKTVCGLHCAANLQVIPAVVNQSKSNRLWPDMP